MDGVYDKYSVIRLRGYGPKVKVPYVKWDKRQRIVIAVRKNEINIDSEVSSNSNMLNGTIIRRLFLGSKIIYQIRLENEDLIEAELLNREIPDNLDTEITLNFDIEHTMAYDYPQDLNYELALE